MRKFKEIIITLEQLRNRLIIVRNKYKGKYSNEEAFIEKKVKFNESLLKHYGSDPIFKVTLWNQFYWLTGFQEEHEVEEFAYTVWGIKPSKIEKVMTGFETPYPVSK